MCYDLETLNLSHIKSKLRRTKVEGPWFFRIRYFGHPLRVATNFLIVILLF
jgi:hypothetical protein